MNQKYIVQACYFFFFTCEYIPLPTIVRCKVTHLSFYFTQSTFMTRTFGLCLQAPRSAGLCRLCWAH